MVRSGDACRYGYRSNAITVFSGGLTLKTVGSTIKNWIRIGYEWICSRKAAANTALLQKHNITACLQQAVDHVIVTQPDKPLEVMAQMLQLAEAGAPSMNAEVQGYLQSHHIQEALQSVSCPCQPPHGARLCPLATPYPHPADTLVAAGSKSSDHITARQPTLRNGRFARSLRG